MSSELAQEMDGKQANWARGECLRPWQRHYSDHSLSDFKSRCREKLEDLGNSAVNAGQYDEMVSRYTAALLLDPSTPQDLLVKRSKAHADRGEWMDALNDANEVVYFQFVRFRPC